MIRFSASIFLIDPEEKILNFSRIIEELPQKAAKVAIQRHDDPEIRPVEIGDCVVVKKIDSSISYYFIVDAGFILKSVTAHEFQLWRQMMSTNITRKLGIEKALGNSKI